MYLIDQISTNYNLSVCGSDQSSISWIKDQNLAIDFGSTPQ